MVMDNHSTNSIDPRLEPVLRRLRGRIRGVLASRGALITAVTALGVLLALAALDLAFAPLPPFVRWMCPVVWIASVCSAAFVWWWMPLREKLDLVRVARWLETHHPELDERVSTVLEVSGRSETGMSSQLIQQLAKEASVSLDGINPSVEVSLRRAKQWLWPALALLIVWAALFAVWPDPTARHVVRALVPTSNLGNAAGRITVTPGSAELIEGDPFQITAVHSNGPQQEIEIVLHLPDGTTTVMPMERRDKGSIYQLGRADRSFEYEVRCGRETSDRFKVAVWPQPRLTDPRVKLEFPAYTGRAPREQGLGDGVSAIVGTKVELKSKLNTPVESARLEIDDEAAGETMLERAADGGGFTSRWTLEKPGHSAGRVVLKHRLGREFEAARFMIESNADAPPEVKWLSAMKKETRVRPDDLLEMGYEVTDDVGLGLVQLEVQPERGESARLPVDAPPRIGKTEPPVWRGRIAQAVGELAGRWPQCRVFKLRVRAEDSRPKEFNGPGVGSSEWVVIRIDDGAESLARQEVAAAQSDARETLEQARQMAQQAREKIDRRREDLKKENVPEDARKDLEQAREQLADAREKLEELADRMEESLNAKKAPDVRKAAETAEQARQQLENTPLQDTPQQRDQSAAAARENAEKTERQLEKLRDDIQRNEPQAQDYARLKELEQQQREIARQAEQAVAKDAQDEPAKPWQQQQDRVAEALRQEAQQQPQAQAAALEKQAQEAKQLAREAREQAAGQEALKQLAQDPAAAEQALHEQLAKEQADIANEAREQLADARERQDNATANAMPEAVESAEKAAAEISAKNDQAAAEKAKEAASQLSEAAKNAEKSQSDKSDESDASQAEAAADLAELAERQENVSEALSALQQGKPAEAAAKLSEMRAEQTAELAEDIRETPQVNGTSGPMQQAANASEQAAGQAKQAAQAESQGKPAEASGSHGQSSQQLQQAAAQLDQAAAEFSQQAAEAAGRKAAENKAPTPAQPLAEAFQQASQAADSNNKAAAANHAQAAADALSQAADGALRAIQGQAPSQPGQGMAQAANQPGNENTEALRTPEADPGVPPELAKLGISAEDWEKIKASLKSDVGGSSAVALPEEYRDLVRSYFEQMSKGSK